MQQKETHKPALQRLIEEDAIGQLRRREGTMAVLGSENGELKLDWVEGVARLLADERMLEQVEEEARDLWTRGIRFIIWAGMGGSIIAVRVLLELGFCTGPQEQHFTLYPLDSTDPAALNRIVRQLAEAKGVGSLTEEKLQDSAFLHTLLQDVLMVGVAMGMTSEEPITHLTWFADLLAQAQLPAAEHLLVMALPNSYLDSFARQRQAPSRPLQLDGGTGTGGRMSAPSTRVFLLPAALYLTRASDNVGQLRAMLQDAWQRYDLVHATVRPGDSPFVQLAVALSDASLYGVCRLLLALPERWQALLQWIEQLMEESLGKDGKGVIVFGEQALNALAPCFRASGTLSVQVVSEKQEVASKPQEHRFTLSLPELALNEPEQRLSTLAASFLGWQLSMALYGYLQALPFAGQPAVENYKARARLLRSERDPLQGLLAWSAKSQSDGLTLFAPESAAVEETAAATFAQALWWAASARSRQPERETQLDYVDLTLNGEWPEALVASLTAHAHKIGNLLLGVPVKVRRAPAAYHSTEQSEMDGSESLVSLRLLVRDHEDLLVGDYSDTFLRAQARSTWQAMLAAGRACFLLLVEGALDEAWEPLERFFHEVERDLILHYSTSR